MKKDNLENKNTSETDKMKKVKKEKVEKVKAQKPQKARIAKQYKEPSKFVKWLKKKINLERRAALEGYIFSLPLIIGMATFFLFPLLLSIVLSFCKLDIMVGFKMHFIGLQNFIDVLINDVRFTYALQPILQDTFFKIPLIVIFSLLLAIIISKNIKFKGFFRVVFFLPFILGTGYVLEQLYSLGVVTQALSIEGSALIPKTVISYLGSNFNLLINQFLGVIVSVLWSSGVQMLLFLSGLQSISPSLYESAGVDGATEWEKFWKITLPMIMPMMVVNIVYTIADSFISVNNKMVAYIKELGFTQTLHDKAAAASWLYTLIILFFIGLVFLLLGRNYGSDTTKGADIRAIKKAKKRRYNW